MDRRVDSILARVRKHGLKVKCLGCRWNGRDRECNGWGTGGRVAGVSEGHTRIRDLRCPVCYSAVCSMSWARRHPDRYREKVALERGVANPFDR